VAQNLKLDLLKILKENRLRGRKDTVKKKIVSKGDFAGHPFRGNQHTGGIYASAA
jgi:hypothetical protein